MPQTIIVGATTAAIELALNLREAGQTVLMVTPLTYPGEDITATWQYYGQGSQDRVLPVLNRLLARLPGRCGQPVRLERLLAGQVKRELQKLLQAWSIETIYMTHFAGLKLHGGRITGALLANKLGVLSCPANRVIDATRFATAACSVNGRPVLIPAGHILSYQLEYFGVSWHERGADAAAGGEQIRPGVVRPDQAYLEITRRCPRPMPLNEAQRFMRAEAAAAAQAWHCERPQMAGAWLAGALPASLAGTAAERPAVRLTGWSDCAPDTDPAELSRRILNSRDMPDQAAPGPDDYLVYGRRIPAGNAAAQPLDDPRCRIPFERISLPRTDIGLPVRTADAAIIGGGTAGLCAARRLLDANRSVQLVEFFGNLGGTRTVGGVNAFYLGNRNARFRAILADISRFAATINAEPLANRLLAAEMLYYNDLFRQRQAAVDLTTVVCGAQAADGTLRAVLGFGENGPVLYQAQIFLDATGDADLVWLAGGQTDYGDPTAGLVQDYSQWYRHSGSPLDPPVSCNLDQDVLDSRYLSEWLRSIRQNLTDAPDYDLVDMLTVRESRRIRGLLNVTLRDVVRRTPCPDIICEAYSDYDPHSRCFRLEGRLGILAQHAPGRTIGIPMRTMIPENLANVLVVAKGIALDQDAFNYVRMNADIMTLGSVGGQIAAQALAQGCRPEQLDLQALQRELRGQGVIGQTEDTALNDAWSIAGRLFAGDETAFADAVLADWPDTAAILNQVGQSREARDPVLVGKTLLWFGDRSGCTGLIACLRELDDRQPDLVYRDRNDAYPGNIKGGCLGSLDDYWLMNQLAYILARAQIAEAAPVLLKMLERTQAGGSCRNDENLYIKGRIDNQTVPNYDRILSLAEAAIAMPRPEFRLSLERLLDDPALSGFRVLPAAAGPGNFHMALLELKVAEAAARCGSAAGLARVAAFREDRHLTLARLAAKLLADIGG